MHHLLKVTTELLFIYLFILLLNESTEYLIICFPICLFNYNDNRYYPHDMWGLLYFDVLMILPVGERLALRTHYMFHTFTGNISKYEVTILRQIRHFGSTTNLAGLEWNLSGVVFSYKILVGLVVKQELVCNLAVLGSLVLGCSPVMIFNAASSRTVGIVSHKERKLRNRYYF